MFKAKAAKPAIRIDEAWKRKLSGGKRGVSWAKAAGVCAGLALAAAGAWLAPAGWERAAEAAGSLWSGYSEPKRERAAQEMAQSCLEKAFTAAGGPGWDIRVRQYAGKCMSPAAMDKLLDDMERSGLAKELERPGSALGGSFAATQAKREGVGAVYAVAVQGSLRLESGGKSAALDKGFLAFADLDAGVLAGVEPAQSGLAEGQSPGGLQIAP